MKRRDGLEITSSSFDCDTISNPFGKRSRVSALMGKKGTKRRNSASKLFEYLSRKCAGSLQQIAVVSFSITQHSASSSYITS